MLPPTEWSLGLTEEERHHRILAEFCERCGALAGDPCVKNWTAVMVHGDRLDAAVARFRQELVS